jgi:electron transfer flavoprotein beta subunit
LNIAVLIKQVVDVELNIRVKNDALVEEGLTYVISNWDEIAIETAIQIIESVGEGTVTLISVGPDRVQDALRRGLAMGADEAVHILDTAIDGSDSYAYAKLFAKILEEQDYDIILGGKQAQDTDAGLTMSMLAEFMDLPQVMNVSKIVSLGKEQCTFHRRGELGNELIDITLPAVLTPNDSLFEPRMPSLRGMMQSKKKPIETKSLSDIGVDPDLVGKSGKKVKVNRLIQPDQRKGGQIFEGEEAETTKQVLALLAKNEVGKENLFT